MHSGLAALRALWRPFLQAVVFADRDTYLKKLAARLALKLVDSHDFHLRPQVATGNAPRRQAQRSSTAFGRANAPQSVLRQWSLEANCVVAGLDANRLEPLRHRRLQRLDKMGQPREARC